MFPLTLRFLGDAGPPATTAEEFVRAVCERHARGDIPDRAARDIVRYEALLLELPAPPVATAHRPRDEDPCIIAPHVRVLVYGADLPNMLEDLRAERTATPRPARGWLVLWRGGEILLPREEGWFLERFREPTTPKEAIEDAEDRTHFETLWRASVLVRA